MGMLRGDCVWRQDRKVELGGLCNFGMPSVVVKVGVSGSGTDQFKAQQRLYLGGIGENPCNMCSLSML